jgi:hypothetical protein
MPRPAPLPVPVDRAARYKTLLIAAGVFCAVLVAIVIFLLIKKK